MKHKFLYLIFCLAVLLLLSIAAMLLWNAILPQVTQLSKINYWQALCLIVLCRVLFGRFNFGNKGRDSKYLLKEKLMGMSENDRSSFKEEWRKRSRGED
jgi:hypothetical protein